MSEILQGTFEGNVLGTRWSRWDDEEQGKHVPILTLECDVGAGDNAKKLFPSLFFDTELATQGADAGKSRLQISLEVLKSYEADVDPENPSNNNPAEFGPAMIGKRVSLYCDAKDGKQRCYLNRGRKPELKEEEVAALWAEMTGGDQNPKPAAPAKRKNVSKKPESDEDLVF